MGKVKIVKTPLWNCCWRFTKGHQLQCNQANTKSPCKSLKPPPSLHSIIWWLLPALTSSLDRQGNKRSQDINDRIRPPVSHRAPANMNNLGSGYQILTLKVSSYDRWKGKMIFWAKPAGVIRLGHRKAFNFQLFLEISISHTLKPSHCGPMSRWPPVPH